MALIIPLPTVTATTLTTLSLLGTAASGGTGPYTYQWYRTFSAVGVYLAVAGATSLTLADTGLAAEQEYSYSLKATDSLAVTGFSGPISAFTAQAALDTNGADAGLAGIVSGGAGGSTETYNTTPPTLTNAGTSPLQSDVNGNLKVTLATGLSKTVDSVVSRVDGNSCYYVFTAGTVTPKSGAGVFRRLIISGGTAGTVVIYDNTAASGNIIASFDSTAALALYSFDVAFTLGLTVVTSAATKISVIYY